MNRGPRQPLDADERTLADSLPRLHGREEPLAGIDAAILSAAHAAVQPPARPTRRRSWIVPTSVAASLCLAMGLAWQLRGPAPLPRDASVRTVTEPAVGDAADARFTAPATADQPVIAPTPPPMDGVPEARPVAAPSMRESAPMAEAQPALASAPAPAPPTVAAPAPVASMPAMAPPPPPAPPPPEPASPQTFEASASSARQQSASGVMERQAKAARPRPEDSEPRASTLDSVAVDAPDDDVPPATMDAPQAREAWLRRIHELQQLGKLDEARASLAEFRRRYPDARVPRDLRSLDPAHVADPPAD